MKVDLKEQLSVILKVVQMEYLKAGEMVDHLGNRLAALKAPTMVDGTVHEMVAKLVVVLETQLADRKGKM